MLLAGAGGFAGSVLRYAVSVFAVPWSLQSGFPVGTFAVNAAGSFLIGLSAALLPAGGWQTFAMAGFCGGFTTFSAFSLEAVRMVRGGAAQFLSNFFPFPQQSVVPRSISILFMVFGLQPFVVC